MGREVPNMILAAMAASTTRHKLIGPDRQIQVKNSWYGKAALGI